jgi:long-chain acyl-CoA synthetase
VVTYDPRQDPEPRLGSAGRVVPGAEIRIIDPDGNDVATGKIGEGIWRAPALMLGYWNESGLTDEAFTADGWFRSRDLVRMDESGYVYVTGRIADTIIRGGSNISPAEVESVIVRHDGVRDVAVVGIADPVYGEEVAAAVVLAPGVDFDPEALAAFCRADLAAYKVPTRYLRVTELPRNANGKLVRRDVVPMIGSDAVSVA